MLNPEALDWDKGDGLLPAIVQHAFDGRVLMLGYMNRDALQHTQASGRVTFFSRSRQALWTKGETSGHGLRPTRSPLVWTATAEQLPGIMARWPEGPAAEGAA